MSEDRPVQPAEGAVLLTLVSYNVHRCVGRDGRPDPRRIVRVLQEIDADIVGLQEVESRLGDVAQAHQADYLAAATGLQGIAGPTILRPDSHYGNLVLTRRPVLAVRTLDLSYPGDREPRGALDLDLEVRRGVVRLIATHLGLRIGERHAQVEALLAHLDGAQDGLVILMGDFNEWLPFGRSLRRLDTYFGRLPSPRTFPSRFPVLGLDRLWVRPRAALIDLRVHRTPLARIASDHLPLKARIALDTPSR